MNSNLLATKLHRPLLPTKRVQRPHLCRRLNEGLEYNRQVTVVSAPAGFGKTTCVLEWLHTLDHWSITWLSLDTLDNDPVRFFSYFVAALQKADVPIGSDDLKGLHSGQLPSPEILTSIFIDQILESEQQILLVLDDLHVIQDAFILQVLEMFLSNLPRQVHLVLIAREDPVLPLARLRANNRLTEIRAQDLRFVGEDIVCFLNDIIGLSLTTDDIDMLEDKTEGWIVGLQLFGLSVRDQAEPSKYIASLSGRHRFILSYLTEQVLSQQSSEIKRFLLQTSILDQMNGDLCNVVTGRSDSHDVLEKLFAANIFVIPLDDEQRWYRYHHLFADLLRNLQQTDLQIDKAELHRRASQWYAEHAFISEAFQHAVKAEDYSMAVAVLENHASDMIVQGYAKTVNEWIQAIPSNWRSQSPRTNLALVWMHLLRGAYVEASSYMERLQASFSQDIPSVQVSLKAEWLVVQSLMAYMDGRTIESIHLAHQALETAPVQDSRVQSLAYYALASNWRMRDRYEQAAEAFQQSIRHGQLAGNLIAEMMSTVGLAMMAFESGQLHLAFEITSPISDRIEQSDVVPPISGIVCGLLGEVCYQWYDVQQARHYAKQALHLSEMGGHNSGIILCRVFFSRLCLLEGDVDGAAKEIQAAIDQIQGNIPEYVRQEAATQRVYVYLAQHCAAEAWMVFQEQDFTFTEAAINRVQIDSFTKGLLYNSYLSLLLFEARENLHNHSLQTAIELATHIITEARKRHYLLVEITALLMRAQLKDEFGGAARESAGYEDYVHALKLAQPEKVIGVFVEQGTGVFEALTNLLKEKEPTDVDVEYIEQILTAFPGPSRSYHANTLVEPLTDRELEVLRLMADGLKYREIAADLFISLNTVRFHVKAIYGKLGVNKRTQAIRAAHDHHLL